MTSPFDTDDIIYKILSEDETITSLISGGVYIGERPDNSTKEDICINTLALSMDTLPQTGTSNVNIHVPDEKVRIGSQQQWRMARARIGMISSQVCIALDKAKAAGAAIRISNANLIAEESTHQHYNNLRVEWNIVKEPDDQTD